MPAKKKRKKKPKENLGVIVTKISCKAGRNPGKFVQEYPKRYTKPVREKMQARHTDGNWRFDSVAYPPHGQTKIRRVLPAKRFTIFCPHCGVKGWRPFRVQGDKILSLDSGELCRTVECWHCKKLFTVSAECRGECDHHLHCLMDGVAHPDPVTPVEKADASSIHSDAG